MTDTRENSDMTKIGQVASRLDGMSYRDAFPERVTKTALKADGLIVVIGASDDIMEIHGAINDEYSGLDSHIILASGEIIPKYDHDGKQIVAGRLKPKWCKSGNPVGWSYKTDIPHATFRVLEDDEIYCIGLVIDYGELIRTAGLYLEIRERHQGSTLFLNRQPIMHVNWNQHGSGGFDLIGKVAENLSKVLEMKLYCKDFR